MSTTNSANSQSGAVVLSSGDRIGVGALGTVIIPAFNEATVIQRTLDHLFHDGLCDHRVVVVVVCNGCTDQTASIVASLPYPVRLLDLPTPGKALAIRAVEAQLGGSAPCLYVDADLLISGRSIVDTLSVLQGDRNVLAARPNYRRDTTGASLLAAAYYRSKGRMTHVVNDLCGGGVYGLSVVGRSRFGEFPNVRADDLFVSRLFEPHEIQIVETEPTVLFGARRLAGILNICVREVRGGSELESLGLKHAAPPQGGLRATIRALVTQMRSPRTTPDAFCYASIVVVARILAKRKTTTQWERDETTR
jgi:glycosyltransferase involved in cell wall biosynthesis